jgi:hypothetical protein
VECQLVGEEGHQMLEEEERVVQILLLVEAGEQQLLRVVVAESQLAVEVQLQISQREVLEEQQRVGPLPRQLLRSYPLLFLFLYPWHLAQCHSHLRRGRKTEEQVVLQSPLLAVQVLQKEDQLSQEVRLWHQELQCPLRAGLLCLCLKHLLEEQVVPLLAVGEGEELQMVVWAVLQL